MNESSTADEAQSATMPEDLRRLYAWANLPPGGYREFSGIRRAYRAEVRASRAAERGVTPEWNAFAAKEMERRDRAPEYGRDPSSATALEEVERTETTLAPVALETTVAEPAIPGDVRDPYEPESFRGVPESDTYDDLHGVIEPEAARALAGHEFASAGPVNARRVPSEAMSVPVMAVFSLANGTGKTSLVATLGRALSSQGEEVQLIETAAEGSLPYYFGTNDLRPGVVRSFAPPPGSLDAPVHLLSYDVAGDTDGHEPLLEAVTVPAAGARRVLLDLNGPWGSVLRKLARRASDASGLTILVPVAPELSSVLRVHAIERYLHAVLAGDGEWVLPNYVLNRYDDSLPQHGEIREMLGGQLGDRLLPFTLRYDGGMGEAFGRRMTVMDLRPQRLVAEDYLRLARWTAERVPTGRAQ